MKKSNPHLNDIRGAGMNRRNMLKALLGGSGAGLLAMPLNAQRQPKLATAAKTAVPHRLSVSAEPGLVAAAAVVNLRRPHRASRVQQRLLRFHGQQQQCLAHRRSSRTQRSDGQFSERFRHNHAVAKRFFCRPERCGSSDRQPECGGSERGRSSPLRAGRDIARAAMIILSIGLAVDNPTEWDGNGHITLAGNIFSGLDYVPKGLLSNPAKCFPGSGSQLLAGGATEEVRLGVAMTDWIFPTASGICNAISSLGG